MRKRKEVENKHSPSFHGLRMGKKVPGAAVPPRCGPNSPHRGSFPRLVAAGSRTRPPERELAAGANAWGCDGWL